MLEKYWDYSNRELIELINNLPNISLDNKNIVKELIIDEYSILIGYGEKINSIPLLLLNGIQNYERISFSLFKLKNDLKSEEIFKTFFGDVLDPIFGDDSNRSVGEKNDFYSIKWDMEYILKNTLNCNCRVTSLFIFIRYLSKFSKIKAFT